MRIVNRRNNRQQNNFRRITPNPHQSALHLYSKSKSTEVQKQDPSEIILEDITSLTAAHHDNSSLNSNPTQSKVREEKEQQQQQIENLIQVYRGNLNSAPKRRERIKPKSAASNCSQVYGEGDDGDGERLYFLTWDDLAFNAWCLKILTLVKILPTDLEMPARLLYVNKNKSRARKFLDKVLFGAWQFYSIIRIITLILATITSINHLEESKTSLDLLRDFSTFLVTFGFIGVYTGYIQATLANMASLSAERNSMQPMLLKTRILNKHLTLWVRILGSVKSLRYRPFRVVLLIYLPFIIYSMMFIVPFIVVLDPNFPILWVSYCLGENFRGVRRFFVPLMFLLDFIFYFFAISLIYIAVSGMLSFMIIIVQEAEIGIEKLRSRHGLDKAKGILQIIKLQMILFNRIMGFVVYVTKLATLAGAILGGAGFIQCFTSGLMFIIPTLFIFLEATTVNLILFDKASQITERVDELKFKILEKAGHPKQNQKTRDEYKRVCRSVQRLGIKPGGFFLIERENTLIFMDYVVGQIVGLLISYSA